MVNECDKTKKAVCSLQKDEVWDFKEVNRLRKFIDELDHVFFVKGEGEEKLDYTTIYLIKFIISIILFVFVENIIL